MEHTLSPSFSHNHGSGKLPSMKGNEYWRDPFSTLYTWFWWPPVLGRGASKIIIICVHTYIYIYVYILYIHIYNFSVKINNPCRYTIHGCSAHTYNICVYMYIMYTQYIYQIYNNYFAGFFCSQTNSVKLRSNKIYVFPPSSFGVPKRWIWGFTSSCDSVPTYSQGVVVCKFVLLRL